MSESKDAQCSRLISAYSPCSSPASVPHRPTTVDKPAKKTDDEVSDFAALKAERLARLDAISASIQSAEAEHAAQIKSLTEEAASLRQELSA